MGDIGRKWIFGENRFQPKSGYTEPRSKTGQGHFWSRYFMSGSFEVRVSSDWYRIRSTPSPILTTERGHLQPETKKIATAEKIVKNGKR